MLTKRESSLNSLYKQNCIIYIGQKTRRCTVYALASWSYNFLVSWVDLIHICTTKKAFQSVTQEKKNKQQNLQLSSHSKGDLLATVFR